MDLLDIRISIEGQLMIMWDSSVPLVSHFHDTTRHGVDFSFLQYFEPLISRFLIHGRLNLRILSVHEVDRKQIAFPSLVLPIFHGILLDDLGFYGPLSSERI